MSDVTTRKTVVTSPTQCGCAVELTTGIDASGGVVADAEPTEVLSVCDAHKTALGTRKKHEPHNDGLVEFAPVTIVSPAVLYDAIRHLDAPGH